MLGDAGLGEEEPERETDGIAVDFARVNPFAAKDRAQASFESSFRKKVDLEPQDPSSAPAVTAPGE